MKTRLVTAGLLAACALAGSAGPAIGDNHEGTVSARVTVADAPCIEVTPASLDFGTLALTPLEGGNGPAQPVEVTSCSGGAQNVLARGTNASSSGGTTWTLADTPPCPQLNRFAQYTNTSEGGTTFLASGNKPIGVVPPSQTLGMLAGLFTACVGSSGAGEVMTFSYVFTAVLA